MSSHHKRILGDQLGLVETSGELYCWRPQGSYILEKELPYPGGSVVKNPLANAGDTGSIPGPNSISGSGKSPGEGNGNSLQYSCLRNPMDRGDSQAILHLGCKRV